MPQEPLDLEPIRARNVQRLNVPSKRDTEALIAEVERLRKEVVRQNMLAQAVWAADMAGWTQETHDRLVRLARTLLPDDFEEAAMKRLWKAIAEAKSE